MRVVRCFIFVVIVSLCGAGLLPLIQSRLSAAKTQGTRRPNVELKHIVPTFRNPEAILGPSTLPLPSPSPIVTRLRVPKHSILGPVALESPQATTSPKTKSSGKIHSFPKALIFTMDSLTTYVQNAKYGGPAGEIAVRRSLERAMRAIDVEVVVASSDTEYENHVPSMASFAFIFVDQWTAMNRQNRFRPELAATAEHVYLLSFFGLARDNMPSSLISSNHILTAFPTANAHGNFFLGFAVESLASTGVTRKAADRSLPEGVIWGKQCGYLMRAQRLLVSVLDSAVLYTTCSDAHGAGNRIDHANLHYVGHQTPEKWHALLAQSQFLLGLGDPLLGPSVLDAWRAGLMFLNPAYTSPKLVDGVQYRSQHQYAAESDAVDRAYTCTYSLVDTEELKACIAKAAEVDLPPYIPPEFTVESHAARVQRLLVGVGVPTRG